MSDSAGSRHAAFRIAPWPRSWLELGGKRTYIITTSRMISGEELKYRNALTGLLDLGFRPTSPQSVTSWRICSHTVRLSAIQFVGLFPRAIIWNVASASGKKSLIVSTAREVRAEPHMKTSKAASSRSGQV